MNQQYLPRGIRNNNPLNIRRGNNKWLGKLPNPTDPEFEQFESVEYGIRAALVCIRTYLGKKYRLRTIEQVISRWAPSTENNTSAYVHYVCTQMQLPSNYALDFSNRNVILMLVEAMAQYECGQRPSHDYFVRAYEMLR